MFVKSLSCARGNTLRHSTGPPFACSAPRTSRRFHTYAPRGWQLLNGLMKRAAILGTPLRFAGEEAGFAFGNTISPWRGMKVQMWHRWDSLNRDLAHWYSLRTITMFQQPGSGAMLTCNRTADEHTHMHETWEWFKENTYYIQTYFTCAYTATIYRQV